MVLPVGEDNDSCKHRQAHTYTTTKYGHSVKVKHLGERVWPWAECIDRESCDTGS